MPVVVTDRAGRPVAGLTRDDFELSEDGKPQAISVFDVLDTARRTIAPGRAG